MRDPSLSSSESYAPLLIRATDQRRSKKLFGLRSTSARFQRKCFFPLSANLRKIQVMVIPIPALHNTRDGVPQAAELLKMSVYALYARVEAGHIPHVRLAQCPEKKWLLYSDVERFRDRAEK